MYVIGISRMSFQFDYILAYQRITSRLRGLHTRLCRDKVNNMQKIVFCNTTFIQTESLVCNHSASYVCNWH